MHFRPGAHGHFVQSPVHGARIKERYQNLMYDSIIVFLRISYFENI